MSSGQLSGLWNSCGQERRLAAKVERERLVMAALPEMDLQISEFVREHGRATMADAMRVRAVPGWVFPFLRFFKVAAPWWSHRRCSCGFEAQQPWNHSDRSQLEHVEGALAVPGGEAASRAAWNGQGILVRAGEMAALESSRRQISARLLRS